MARLRGAGRPGALRHQQLRADPGRSCTGSLAHCGITAEDADLLSSADVAAGMLAPGSTAVVLGDGRRARGAGRPGRRASCPRGRPTPSWWASRAASPTTIVARAAAAVRGGARLVGTNEDPTFPTPDGLVPGAGAILAAVATAAEADARGGGQAAPADGRGHRRPGARRASCGPWWGTARPPTARWPPSSGIPFALVLSGVTPQGHVPADADAGGRGPDLATSSGEALGGPT